MAYWSIAVLILSISFLAYRHPPSLEALPPWLRPAKPREGEDDENSGKVTSDEKNMPDDAEAVESEVKIAVEDPMESKPTPKVETLATTKEVRTLNLDGSTTGKGNPSSDQSKAPSSSPVANGALKIPSMPPPPRPISASRPSTPSPSVLMPPPARPNSTPPLSAASSLRVPSTGPLPNRGLPANSQQRVSGSTLMPNGNIPNSNSRGKVLLSPGHSPMDWAALTRSSNLSGVGTFQRVPPSVLKTMTGRKGKPAWSSWQGKVYNITPYIPFHPGGEAEIMKAAGRDGTKLFMEIHPWVNWENMLGTCLVGVMVPENHGTAGPGGSSLEDMD